MAITIGCTKEFLEKSYAQIENLRLQILEELYKIQREMEHWDVLDKSERTNIARADYDGKTLKIVVNDVLPRHVSGVKNSLMRVGWCQSIIDAIQTLRETKGANPTFEKALCHITVYHYLDTRWDIDNRAFKYLIDGLVCARVIPDDSWQYLTLMVTGKYDKERPRTEIALVPLHQKIEVVLKTASNPADHHCGLI
ncbi:MAG: hypothetical protein C4575_07020 [Desulforudis sp.]|nr:MAG: hypothetical protein C4575_07020 [Desulforudis sp.]